jgi:hypothetical protein
MRHDDTMGLQGLLARALAQRIPSHTRSGWPRVTRLASLPDRGKARAARPSLFEARRAPAPSRRVQGCRGS